MYQIDFTSSAESDLARLDAQIAQRVLNKLRWLAENFDVIKPEPLAGQWQGAYKLRVGDYRVLYTYCRQKQKLIVHFVRHRREVYKLK